MKRKCVAPKFLAGLLTLAMCVQPIGGFALTSVSAEEIWGGDPVAEASETDILTDEETGGSVDVEVDVSADAEAHGEAEISVNLETDGSLDIPADLKSDDVLDSQLASYVPAGMVPKAGWNDEQWKIYKRGVAKKLSVSANDLKVYYMDLDGEPMTDYKLYYMNDAWPSSDTTLESDFTLVEQSADYPGCFIFDKKGMPDRPNYFVYKKDETDIYRYVLNTTSYGDYAFVMDGDSVSVRHAYTMSFEQGDVEMKKLPDTKYYWDGEQIGRPWVQADNMASGLHAFLEGFYEAEYFAAGYGVNKWVDQNGKSYDNKYLYDHYVTEKKVMHPVFVNEQDMELKSGVEVIQITSAQQFLEKLYTQNVLVIDGDIMINADEVNTYRNRADSHPSYYWNEALVVVAEGGELTFDNVYTMVSSGSPSSKVVNLVVQDGGTLKLQNKADAYASNEDCGLFISVQDGGVVEIEDAGWWDMYGLHNHGTVRSVKPETPNGNDSVNRTYMNIGRDFFNAKEGKIQLTWGRIDVDNDELFLHARDWKRYDSYDASEFEKYFIPNVNSGTIELKENGAFILSGSSGVYQHNRTWQMPFVNRGTISCTSVPTNNFHGSALEVNGSVIQNMEGAQIIVQQPEHTPPYGDSIASYAGSSQPGMDLYESVLINEGDFIVKAKSNLGVRLDGVYFDPKDYSYPGYYGEPEVTEIQYGRIENRDSGTITLESDADSVALGIEKQCVLLNDGQITINQSDCDAKTDNFTLYSEGLIRNTGSIVNNDIIGYSCSYGEYWAMSRYEGTPYTGTGTECYAYSVMIENEKGSQIAWGTPVTVWVDDVSFGTLEGTSGIDAFFCKDSTYRIKMQAEGYQDTTVEITTAKDFASYAGSDEEHRNNAFHAKMTAVGGGNTGGESGGSGESGESGESGGSGTGGSGSGGSGTGGSGTGGSGSGGSGTGGSGSGGSGTGGSGSGGSGSGGSGDNGGTGSAETEMPKEGKVLDDKKSGSTYVVTESGKADGNKVSGAEVQFSSADKKAKTATVPATVKIDNVTYKVTSIKKNAFKNNKSLTKVTVGGNVAQIGKNAFAGCKKLKTIKIKSKKIKKIDKNAFKGIDKNAVITVPKKQKKAYTDLLRKAGYKGKIQ